MTLTKPRTDLEVSCQVVNTKLFIQIHSWPLFNITYIVDEVTSFQLIFLAVSWISQTILGLVVFHFVVTQLSPPKKRNTAQCAIPLFPRFEDWPRTKLAHYSSINTILLSFVCLQFCQLELVKVEFVKSQKENKLSIWGADDIQSELHAIKIQKKCNLAPKTPEFLKVCQVTSYICIYLISHGPSEFSIRCFIVITFPRASHT